MKIAIIVALPEEYRAVVAGLSAAGMIVQGDGLLGRASAQGHHVVVALSGMGFDNAARTAERLVCAETPDLFISSGFCGAISRELRVGDVVVAQSLMVRNESGFDEVPVLFADAGQNFVVRQTVEGRRLFAGTFVSTSAVVAKKTLAAIVPSYCHNPVVEMESFAVALVAGEQGVPLLALRAVSDDATEELCFTLDEFCDRDLLAIRPHKVLLTALKRPAIIPQLYRLARNSSHAAAELQAAFTALFTQLQGTSRG